MKKHFLQTSLLAALLGLLGACSPSDQAGTASEGESFVYGYVLDSSVSLAALAKTQATSGIRVVLSQESYGEDGLRALWRDTVSAQSNGYFAVAMPRPGTYTLVAISNTGAARVHSEISYQPEDKNLGNLGLFKPIELNGSLEGLPACDSARLSLPGRPDFALLGSDGSFALSQAMPGHTQLLFQCGDTVQQWPLFIPGRCASVSVEALPWTESPGNQGQSLAAGKGYNGDAGFAWQWRKREAIALDGNCRMSATRKAGP